MNWRDELEMKADAIGRLWEEQRRDEDDAKAIRQALLRMERQRQASVVLWLSGLLVASLVANVAQGLLYVSALQHLTR